MDKQSILTESEVSPSTKVRLTKDFSYSIRCLNGKDQEIKLLKDHVVVNPAIIKLLIDKKAPIEVIE